MSPSPELKAIFGVASLVLAVGCGSSLPIQGSGTAGSSGGGTAGTGVAGTGGGGTAGTGTGGTGGGSGAACGMHDRFGTKLQVINLGPKAGAYDGLATVERSTTEELVLA